MTRDPIRDVLAKYLPEQGTVLEVASGTGERLIALASHFTALSWQPSERDPGAVAALAGRCEGAAHANVLPSIELDVTMLPWSLVKADAILCFDYVHAVSLDILHATFAGAARTLPSGGLLYLYGPFRFHGKYASKEDEELDLTLRARDPALGIRDIREITVAGTRTGIGVEHVVGTPPRASLILRRRAMLPPTGQFKIG